MMKKILLFFLFIWIAGFNNAQIPIGTFREHLPYHSFRSVAVSEDYVYGATAKSLMLIRKSDKSTSTLSKLDGLSEIGISKIYHDDKSKTLIIAYQNSNIDFIRNDQLFNVPDIKNKQGLSSKEVHDIIVHGDIAYFSCSFGVVLVDINNFLVKDTWFTTLNNETYSVNNLLLFDDSYYITTSKGVFSINKESQNIADFRRWNKVEELGTENCTLLLSFQDRLLTVVDNALMILEDGAWSLNNTLPCDTIVSIDVNATEICICDGLTFWIYDDQWQLLQRGAWSEWWRYPSWGNQLAMDGEAGTWIADEHIGLAYLNRDNTFDTIYTFPGPFSELAESIDIVDNRIVTVPGTHARENSYHVLYFPGSVSYLIDGYWGYNRNAFRQGEYAHLHDLVKVVINPRKPSEYFVGTWGEGLLKMEDNQVVKQYDETNSPLEIRNGVVLVSGLCFDQNNNLWITNSQANYPLKVLRSDGQFTSYSLSPYITSPIGSMAEHILVDSRNYKWITFPRMESGPVVFSEKSITDASQGYDIGIIDMNSKARVVTKEVTCIAEDKSGYIWLGTEQGVKVVYYPYDVFGTNKGYAENILILQDYWQSLLEFEYVTAIAVDGADRKWIGTAKAGVFLMSADGTEELLHFTEENSPLHSNQIISIAINHANGEVFFSTPEGMLSYRGTATKGKEDYAEAKVFPNPVKDGYNGPIAVSGLMDNSFCKIVDASGALVWQGYANGGELIWNGQDLHGKRPATGVYFVFASSSSGKEKKVAKILFIN